MTSVYNISSFSSEQLEEFWACLALKHTSGIGHVRAGRLFSEYGSALAAVKAERSQKGSWLRKRLVTEAISAEFATENWRKSAKIEWLAATSQNLKIILRTNINYPVSLNNLSDAPLYFYFDGDFSLLSNPGIGVVGSRRCTSEGIAVSAFFSKELSQNGLTIVSGMAKGIDRAAHIAGMDGVGGSIGVLGTGIDVVYPQCNFDVAKKMREQGLLISEFAPGTKASPSNFPVRNRLISGLSVGILVIEAAGRSGSLITARLALDQGKDVFAVPGHTMSAASGGCRDLIRSGAKPVFTASDVLIDLLPVLSKSVAERVRKQVEQKSFDGDIRGFELNNINSAISILPDNEIPWAAPSSSDSFKANSSTSNSSINVSSNSKILSHNNLSSAVSSHSDVFHSYSSEHVVSLSKPKVFNFSDDELKIIKSLSLDPVHIDVICQNLDMDVSIISSLLLMLEIQGAVVHHAGMHYSLPG